MSSIDDENIRELLHLYPDGELSLEEEERVVRYLEGHPEARALVEDIEELKSGLRSLPRPPVPDGFAGRVLEVHARVGEEQGGQSTRRIQLFGLVSLAAAAVLGLALLEPWAPADIAPESPKFGEGEGAVAGVADTVADGRREGPRSASAEGKQAPSGGREQAWREGEQVDPLAGLETVTRHALDGSVDGPGFAREERAGESGPIVDGGAEKSAPQGSAPGSGLAGRRSGFTGGEEREEEQEDEDADDVGVRQRGAARFQVEAGGGAPPTGGAVGRAGPSRKAKAPGNAAGPASPGPGGPTGPAGRGARIGGRGGAGGGGPAAPPGAPTAGGKAGTVGGARGRPSGTEELDVGQRDRRAGESGGLGSGTGTSRDGDESAGFALGRGKGDEFGGEADRKLRVLHEGQACTYLRTRDLAEVVLLLRTNGLLEELDQDVSFVTSEPKPTARSGAGAGTREDNGLRAEGGDEARGGRLEQPKRGAFGEVAGGERRGGEEASKDDAGSDEGLNAKSKNTRRRVEVGEEASTARAAPPMEGAVVKVETEKNVEEELKAQASTAQVADLDKHADADMRDEQERPERQKKTAEHAEPSAETRPSEEGARVAIRAEASSGAAAQDPLEPEAEDALTMRYRAILPRPEEDTGSGVASLSGVLTGEVGMVIDLPRELLGSLRGLLEKAGVSLEESRGESLGAEAPSARAKLHPDRELPSTRAEEPEASLRALGPQLPPLQDGWVRLVVPAAPPPIEAPEDD